MNPQYIDDTDTFKVYMGIQEDFISKKNRIVQMESGIRVYKNELKIGLVENIKINAFNPMV